jgi:hypothetical protein
MPAVFTTYPNTQARGFPGMLGTQDTSRRVTRSVEGAGGLAFGAVAVAGAGERSCKASAAGAEFIGIAIVDKALPVSNANKYVTGDSAALMTSGEIWVVPAITVVAGAPAYYVPASGNITSAATAGNFKIGQFVTNGTAADIVLLRVDAGTPVAV